MPEASISGISFKIEGSANSAIHAIDNLLRKLQRLNQTLGGVNVGNFTANMSRLASSASRLTGSLGSIGTTAKQAASGFSDVSSRAQTASGSLGEVDVAAKSMSNEFKNVSVSGKTATGAIDSLGASAKATAKDFKLSTLWSTKFLTSLGRIAMYRLVRSILSSITGNFKEGFEALYQYSRAMGTEFAPAVDQARAALNAWKASLATAVAPLIEIMIPALTKVISLLIEFHNALAAAFASIKGLFTGDYTYTAIAGMGELADATTSVGSAAKEALKYLAPFDELNRLPGNNEGGGSGGVSGPGSSTTWEEREASMWDWTKLLPLIKIPPVDIPLKWGTVPKIPPIPTIPTQGIPSKWNALPEAPTIPKLPAQEIPTNYLQPPKLQLPPPPAEYVPVFYRYEELQLPSPPMMNVPVKYLVPPFDTKLLPDSVTYSPKVIAPSQKVQMLMEPNMEPNALTYKPTVTAPPVKTTVPVTALPEVMPNPMVAAPPVVNFLPPLVSESLTVVPLPNVVPNPVIAAAPAVNFLPSAVSAALNVNVLPNLLLSGEAKVAAAAAVKKLIEKLFGGGNDNNSGPGGGTPIQIDAPVIVNPQYQLPAWDPDEEGTIVDPRTSFENELNNYLAGITANAEAATAANPNGQGWEAIGKTFGVLMVPAMAAAIVGGLPAEIAGLAGAGGLGTGGLALANGFVLPVTPELRSPTYATPNVQTQLTKPTFTPNLAAPIIPASVGKQLTATSMTPTLQTPLYANGVSGKLTATTMRPTLATPKYGDGVKDRLTATTMRPTLATPKYGDGVKDRLTATTMTPTMQSPKYAYGVWAALTGTNMTATIVNKNVANSLTDQYGNMKVDTVLNVTSVLGLAARIQAIVNNIFGGGKARGGAYYGGSWHSIPQYASGGSPHGSLFLAGEAGPEIVGHVGGRTEVLNQSQLAASISAGVARAINSASFQLRGVSSMPTYAEDEDTEEAMYRATIRALQTLGITGDALSNIEAHISSGEVYDSVRTSNRQNTRMTGVNDLA